MSYWTVRKIHTQEAYNDSNWYALLADDKVIMKFMSQQMAEDLQMVADIHNQEVMNN